MKQGRAGWILLLVILAGGVAWSGLLLRLQRRCLHILQLEAYQSLRFLSWWLRRPTRVTPPREAAGATVGVVLAGVIGLCPPPLRPLAALIWAACGLALARPGRQEEAKKPLVMTARARRLAIGQAVVQVAVALGLARLAAVLPSHFRRPGSPGVDLDSSLANPGSPDDAQLCGSGTQLGAEGAALACGLSALAAPVITVAANLLLFPIEAAVRRYYLLGAARKLRRLSPTVVAVAGSYGKTSTKEFIATILSARFEVLRPPGSHNTPMGLCRVIREQLGPQHEIFVAELGDWVPGDIASLCRLLQPRIGVLTTIGPEHLERFKTMARVEASKLELLQALPAEGTAVINQDDESVRRLGDRTPRARVLRYGQEAPGARVRARDVRSSRAGLEFVVEAEGRGQALFRVAVLGRHNVANLLAATSVGLALGMSLEEIARAAARIRPVEHRLQPIAGNGDVLIIDDAFNSNPRGAAAALDVLADIDAGQRILVTPGMVELAELEFAENRAFARRAARVCDQVIVVGRDRAEPLVAGLRDESFPAEHLHVVGDLAEASLQLGKLVRAGDVVLFENDLPDNYADVP